MSYKISDPVISGWFEDHERPSPTCFALDFGIAPGELRAVADENELVQLALYRIIAYAEEALYDKVQGPKAVIQRVELFLPVKSVEDDDEVEYSFAN